VSLGLAGVVLIVIIVITVFLVLKCRRNCRQERRGTAVITCNCQLAPLLSYLVESEVKQTVRETAALGDSPNRGCLCSNTIKLPK